MNKILIYLFLAFLTTACYTITHKEIKIENEVNLTQVETDIQRLENKLNKINKMINNIDKKLKTFEYFCEETLEEEPLKEE